MRTVVLLSITLLGSVAGLFAGAYGYHLSHPIRAVPSGTRLGRPYDGLQAVHRGEADAIEHHLGRQNWIIGGALLGAGAGFVGTVLVSRAVGVGGGRGRPDSDPAT